MRLGIKLDLPRTDAGKLYKRKIRDEYLAAMEGADS